MKGRPIEQLVYECLFPRPKPSDPANFNAFLTRHLIYEVRQEVQSFYGHLDDQEAKYPGLDYCHPTHRLRLSRWQWHRRLFRAFDGLRLTNSEISGLTKWEGTKWAKERYEKEQGITIRDTTADGFPYWVEPEDRPSPVPMSSRAQSQDVEDEDEEDQEEEDEDAMDADDSDGELRSVGDALNERLRERVAAHNAGDTSLPLDEEWEQWLKNAIETGEFPMVPEQLARLSTNPPSVSPHDLLPRRIVEAARQGNWHEVPEILHSMLRRSLGMTAPGQGAPSASSMATSRRLPVPIPAPNADYSSYHAWRRDFSDLRLPSQSEQATSATADLRLQRIARAPGA